MDYVWYLFRFEGRLNRARCWQALLISICWMIFLPIVTIGVVLLLGGSGPTQLWHRANPLCRRSRSRSWANAPVLFFQAAGSVAVAVGIFRHLGQALA